MSTSKCKMSDCSSKDRDHLSTPECGRPEQKLRLLFMVYDADKDQRLPLGRTIGLMALKSQNCNLVLRPEALGPL